MPKKTSRPPFSPESASVRKVRRTSERVREDDRIHTVWFQGEAMRAWDFSGLSDEFIQQLVKLPPAKRGPKVRSRTLERIATVRKRRAERASWRQIARELYPDRPFITAQRNLSSLRRTHKL